MFKSALTSYKPGADFYFFTTNRRIMSTVLARCFAVGIRLKPDQLKLIGSVICSRFYEQTTIKHFVLKKDQKEKNCTFKDYPPAFTPQIDEELRSFAHKHFLPIKPPKKKRERKRIATKKPLYSVRPKNK
jgi:hypothetical protein